MRYIFTLVLLLSVHLAFSQDNGFAYGLVTMNQLEANSYSRDSSASAIMLREFGESYVRVEEDGGLIVTNLKFEHHYLIKILKTDGLKKANITIPLYKGGNRRQRLINIKASAYNIHNNKIQETQLMQRDIIHENKSTYWDEKKITIPNVRVGSIIEVQYTLEDPFFVLNFHPWEFQSDIPKISSEYWASIPGNYRYNITSRGALNFTRNENEVIRECFNVPGAGTAGDCVLYKFAIENIPAFKIESFMTAKANFLSAVYFELSEKSDLSGRVEKFTKDWNYADSEIRTHSKLGSQLKKGKDIIESLETELKSITDPLEKAKRIYAFINTTFLWDRYLGAFSDDGIKKAFEKKTGNIGDINLSLIAAMRAADLDVEIALLSTRENGVPTELHPVITDFNYVVAKVNISDKSYLVDASDPYLPFGMLPLRCLNGKARAFPEKGPSYWHDIKPAEKFKEVTVMNLALQANGSLKGTLEYSYYGYEAYDKRTDLASFNNQEDYLADLKKKMDPVIITSFDLKGIPVNESRVLHKFDVEIEMLEQLGEGFMLNPFFLDKMQSNPFTLSERLYPVDFGAAYEHTIILNLTYPENFMLVERPEKSTLNLPGGGGKFLFDITDNGSKAAMTYSLSLTKPAYHSGEYKYIKELFNRVIQVQNFDWLFKKKE